MEGVLSMRVVYIATRCRPFKGGLSWQTKKGPALWHWRCGNEASAFIVVTCVSRATNTPSRGQPRQNERVCSDASSSPTTMRIEELVLDGFKSYPVRTVITGWDSSFNAITGLNGSGKSNILDAICFVLGITNMTSVRGNITVNIVRALNASTDPLST